MHVCLKESLNASKLNIFSIPQTGEKIKMFGWEHRLQRRDTFMAFITWGQQYHVGEKPTVTLYTYYIDHPAGTPNKTKTKDTMSLDTAQFCYIR